MKNHRLLSILCVLLLLAVAFCCWPGRGERAASAAVRAAAVWLQNMPDAVGFRAMCGRRKDDVAAGLTYTVQFSPELVTWQTSTARATVLASDALIAAGTLPYPFFVNGRKARFFRVQVTLP